MKEGEINSKLNGKLMDVSGSGVSDGTNNIICDRIDGLNQQSNFFDISKTHPINPQINTSQKNIGSSSETLYFPIPIFHEPFSDPNSIVDALKCIGVNSSLSYRAIIGKKNKIPGRPGHFDYNVKMLNLLKNGRLLRP